MFSAQGTLLYDPVRDNLKRTDQSHTLVLDFPSEDLTDYYQWFLKRQYGEKFKLQSPMFGTHVTVVRPQEFNLEHAAWLKYQGQELTFFYQWFCQGNYGTRTSCSATYYNPPPPDPPVYAPGCAYRLSGVPIAFASGYSTPHAPCTIICYGTGPSAVCDIF